MFILLTIIVFGVFVVIVYWLFEDEIREMLSGMMDTTNTIVDDNLQDVLGQSGSNRVPTP